MLWDAFYADRMLQHKPICEIGMQAMASPGAARRRAVGIGSVNGAMTEQCPCVAVSAALMREPEALL